MITNMQQFGTRTHVRHVGDTLTPLAVQLVQQTDADPQGAPVDLTGKTVLFRLLDSTGNAAVPETSQGVSITQAAQGRVQYQFQAGAALLPAVYYGYFVVQSGGQRDTFPVDTKGLRIVIAAD